MRSTFLLIGAVILFAGACSSNKAPLPPPLPNKEWVNAKWKNSVDVQFLSGFEFNKDGDVKLTFRGMKEPITARFIWSGDRDVEVEYPKKAEAQQAYEAAAKAYKDEINEGVKKGTVDGRAKGTLLGLVADKMPDKETYRVGITDPKYLILTRKIGVSQGFEKSVSLSLEKVD